MVKSNLLVKSILPELGFFLTEHNINNVAILLHINLVDYIEPKPGQKDQNDYIFVAGYDLNTNQIIAPNQQLVKFANNFNNVNTYSYRKYTDTNWEFYQMYFTYLNRVFMPINDIWVLLQQFVNQDNKHLGYFSNLLTWYYYIIYMIRYKDNYPINFAIIDNYVKANNYTYNYFNVVNPTQIENKAALNQLNLDFNSFENGLQFMGMENQESKVAQDQIGRTSFQFELLNGAKKYSDEYPLNLLVSWSKDKLLQAIIASGLVESRPDDEQLQIVGQPQLVPKGEELIKGEIVSFGEPRGRPTEYQPNTDQPNVRFKFSNALISYTQIYKNTPDLQQRIERNLYLQNNYLDFDKLGLPSKYGSKISLTTIYQHKDTLGLIYRRIYGTIYTIDWQRYCQSPQLTFMPGITLQNILDVYYGKSLDLDPKMISCNAIVQSTPRIRTLMNSVQNVDQWIGYLLQQYQNSETFAISQSKTKGKRGAEQDDEQGKRRRE